MSNAFEYRPRFVDIRIKPPNAKRAAANERACDYPECAGKGTCRAPKGPDKLGEHYMFCPSHAAEYNRNWDFFSGMSDDEVVQFQRDAAHGHRPTWGMGAGDRMRDTATRAKRDWGRVFVDSFGLFGDKPAPQPDTRERRLGKLEKAAFDTLGLDHDAKGEDIRARYTELVKAYHPDANGGDRSTENRLTLVIRAFKTLKKSGLA